MGFPLLGDIWLIEGRRYTKAIAEPRMVPNVSAHCRCQNIHQHVNLSGGFWTPPWHKDRLIKLCYVAISGSSPFQMENEA